LISRGFAITLRALLGLVLAASGVLLLGGLAGLVDIATGYEDPADKPVLIRWSLYLFTIVVFSLVGVVAPHLSSNLRFRSCAILLNLGVAAVCVIEAIVSPYEQWLWFSVAIFAAASAGVFAAWRR
jgi:hypothetical protein